MVLQWATYRDASDQCSLSRIWGGIHPPADDIPGRLIGIEVAEDVWELALSYFNDAEVEFDSSLPKQIYPVPTQDRILNITNTLESDIIEVFDLRGRLITIPRVDYNEQLKITTLHISSSTASGMYLVSINGAASMIVVDK